MGKRKVAGVTLAIGTAALLLATELPQGLSKAVGGSTALAELAARSPGARIGGVALKAKAPRSELAPIAGGAAPGLGGPEGGTPVASVLGASGVPEGAVPSSGPGGFPSDFLAPGIPDSIGAAAPAVASAAPGGLFGGVPLPGGGGLPLFIPGGTGGGGGGGGGSPGTGTTPGGGLVPPPGPTPGAGAIPEPATWLMLIGGFAAIGSAMRRSKRVRFA